MCVTLAIILAQEFDKVIQGAFLEPCINGFTNDSKLPTFDYIPSLITNDVKPETPAGRSNC